MRWGEPKDHAEKIIKISRERYSMPRAEVEQKIERWSSALFENEEEEDGAKGQKEKYKTRCSVCGKEVLVNFKPDDRRPIYCAEHLKQVEAGEIKPVPTRRPVGGGRERYDDSLSILGIDHAPESERKEIPATGPRRDFLRPGQSPGGFRRPPGIKEGSPVLKSGEHPKTMSLQNLRPSNYGQPRFDKQKRGPDLGGLRKLLKETAPVSGENDEDSETGN
jgi:CxxC-x17-CxxC domain-containing protein